MELISFLVFFFSIRVVVVVVVGRERNRPMGVGSIMNFGITREMYYLTSLVLDVCGLPLFFVGKDRVT